MKHLPTFLLAGALALPCFAADKAILLIAGTASHGPGEHEHNAGLLLIQKCLAAVPGVRVTVSRNGWPTNADALQNADAVVMYCDGGDGHLAVRGDHLEQLAAATKRGVGFGCIHYAVQPPEGRGAAEFIAWMGGRYEIHWSVNPWWEADFKTLPEHPVTRGVKPFKLLDEWYFHMRFTDGGRGVTPILQAIPPATTMSRPDGPHSGNPAVREAVKRGDAQTVMWVYERADGGRAFGFTGAHQHTNWGNADFRKVVLNALLWIAKVEVPPQGVPSVVTTADLQANLDPKGK